MFSIFLAACLSSRMHPAELNKAVLDRIEALGGGYVWEPETFSVVLGVPRSDAEVEMLQRLSGVEQIAVNATKLSYSTLQGLAQIPALASLVLGGARLSDQQLEALRLIGPEIELVDAEDLVNNG